VKSYADSVPDNFLFTVKAPNSVTLTHFYAKQPSAYREYANRRNPNFLNVDLLNRFLDILKPMKGKLGPIMFQGAEINLLRVTPLLISLIHLLQVCINLEFPKNAFRSDLNPIL